MSVSRRTAAPRELHSLSAAHCRFRAAARLPPLRAGDRAALPPLPAAGKRSSGRGDSGGSGGAQATLVDIATPRSGSGGGAPVLARPPPTGRAHH